MNPSSYEQDRCFVWYELAGRDLDPEEVTATTGMRPNLSVRAGDPHPPTSRREREGVWRIDSGLGEGDEFHDHLAALLEHMRPAWEVFVQLGARYDARVEAAIYLLDAQGPLVQVLPAASAALAELRATLGFDLYALAENQNAGPDDPAR